MKSAKQTTNGAKTMSLEEAENVADRIETESTAAKAVFKKAKAALKLARKTAKAAKKAVRKSEKDAARARKTVDQLREQAKKASVQKKKPSARNVAASGSVAPAKRALRRKSLATLASDHHTALSDPDKPRQATVEAALSPVVSQAETQDQESDFPSQLQRPEDEHSEQ